MNLTVGGQCEGYSGIFMALKTLLPVEHAWYAETDINASKVLAHHYPGVSNHGDITAYAWAQARPVDIFTSGFPCQPMSNAGPRRGSDDERHLWPVGVLPAIRALMPPLVVLENVPGLLTVEHGQIFAQVLADLDNLGYTVSWAVVGACRVGACHHRHRVFIAATLVSVDAPMSDPIAHREGPGWSAAQTVLFGDAEAVRWPAAGFTRRATAWEMIADPCGASTDVFPTPVSSLGRQCGFPSPETALRRRDNPKRTFGLDDAVALLPTPTVQPGSRGEGFNNGGEPFLSAAIMPERFGKYAAAVLRHEHAYSLPAPDPTEPGRNGKPRLAPAFPEWMQGLPRGYLTEVVDRKSALKLAGNGVNWRQGAYALSTLPTFRAAVKAPTAGLAVAS